MTRLPRLRSFLRALFSRSGMEREMDAELGFHVDARTDDLIAAGLSPDAARRRAHDELGDTRRWKEAGRESRGLAPIDAVRGDVRYGLRCLRRSPAFAAATVLSMAIGIGANTAIFSLVNAVLLKTLPVEHPESLVLLGLSNDAQAVGSSFPYPFYRQLQQIDGVVGGVIASASMGPSIEIDGQAERVSGELVSGNYFEMLGVRPHIGRLINADDVATAREVIVLGYRYWQNRFHGDRAAIGRSVRVNGRPMTVIGVTPPHFGGLELGASPDVRVPISLQAAMHGGPSRLESPREWWLQIVARVAHGATYAQAADVLNQQYLQFRAQSATPNELPDRLDVLDGRYGRPTVRQRLQQPLVILTVLVGVVLVLVCVNVGNLMLARATARQREMSVRLALGAGRLRILRQLVVEALLLAGLAGALGLGFAVWGARALALLSGAPADFEIALDLRVLGFASSVAIATGLVCGLGPGWSAGKVDLLGMLKVDTARVTGTQRGRRLLVTAQIALSLTLLAGGGLFARTLFNLRHAGFGFQTEQLALVTLNPVLNGYTKERVRQFYDDVLQRVSMLPNVESAAFAMMPVLAGDAWGSGLTLDTGEHDDNPGPLRNAVGPGFFEALGISFREGRSFTSLDTAPSTPVAIVNEAFARRYFPDKSAIGRRIGQGGDQGIARYTIVGVTRDTKVAEVKESARPFWYVPLAQLPGFDQLTLHVRTTRAPEAALDDISRAIASVDRSGPILEAATMRQQIDDQVDVERLLAVLANVFAGVAVLLASFGLYGVMSYLTTAKAREMSIRMALGASPGAMLRLVFGRSAFVIVGGLLAGLGIAVAAGRQVQPLLFELDSADPPTLIGATAIVLLVALAATGLPARRASKTNPADALR
jgi:predicted permease